MVSQRGRRPPGDQAPPSRQALAAGRPRDRPGATGAGGARAPFYGAGGAAADRKQIKSDIDWAKRELAKAEKNDPGGTDEIYWEGKLAKAEAKLEKSKNKGGVARNVRDVNEIIDQILAMFGIDELINEALICLTMGSSFS